MILCQSGWLVPIGAVGLFAAGVTAVSLGQAISDNKPLHHKRSVIESEYPVRIALVNDEGANFATVSAVSAHDRALAGKFDQALTVLQDGATQQAEDEGADSFEMQPGHKARLGGIGSIGGERAADSLKSESIASENGIIDVDFKLTEKGSSGGDIEEKKGALINGRYVGDVSFIITGPSRIYVRGDDLLRILNGQVPINFYKKFEDFSIGKDRVAFNDIRMLGLGVKYDIVSDSVLLNYPPS